MSDEVYEQAAQLYKSVGEILASPALQETEHPLRTVAAVHGLGDQTARMMTAAVAAARASGATWQQIGQVLGVSRQAAFQRFGRVPLREEQPQRAAPGIGADDADAAAVSGAATVLGHLASGSWQAVVDRFDDAMLERLGPEGLAAAWTQIVDAAGPFVRHGATEASRAAGLTVTNTLLEFERDECTARIAFRQDGRISGLFILAGPPS